MKIISPISPIPAHSKLRQIWKFLKRMVPELVYRCVLCDARTETEIIANCNTPIFSDA